MESFEEKIINIAQVEELWAQGYEIEVDSPDGWVRVNEEVGLVDKGEWEAFELHIPAIQKTIVCNENHLFETTDGWKYAKDLIWSDHHEYITEFGVYPGTCRNTGKKVPIVDINVEHENHRYYTDGVSSHNTGVGKSLFMCSMSANLIEQGNNVLYITMEMAEEKIAQRIDQNLMSLSQEDMDTIGKDTFLKRFNNVKLKTNGRLVVKEYPTKSAHAGHFRALLKELEQKKNFVPDLICIDYLNICASQNSNKNSNSYEQIKNTAEELRALAMEFNVPVLTATQTNRSGYSDTDVDITSVSESFGLPMTADYFFAMTTTDKLREQGLFRFTQLKNRYGDPADRRNWLLNVDYAKMKVTDLAEQPAMIDAQNEAASQSKTDMPWEKRESKPVSEINWG